MEMIKHDHLQEGEKSANKEGLKGLVRLAFLSGWKNAFKRYGPVWKDAKDNPPPVWIPVIGRNSNGTKRIVIRDRDGVYSDYFDEKITQVVDWIDLPE